ncbi:argininosuccinate lyase [Paenibacillus terreus]|uniref:argininosuccinate lyase n=1 Tax=Paenibacillus terreus TaxID=1387834 RepID=A0ABV5B5R9_9BACL
MNPINEFNRSMLTGRLLDQPNSFIHDEILNPQFRYEVNHLLPYYILIEKVITREYERMGLLGSEALQNIMFLLDQIDPETLVGSPQGNMTDILFAIECYVEQNASNPITAWHLDRSRNDVQATAQLMLARDKLLEIVESLLELSDETHKLAQEHIDVRMPGYTHYQSAQIISVGFFFTALIEQLGKIIDRLISQWGSIDECPLGSGAMSGLELQWDRKRMACMLGFERPCRHALMGVASKEYMLLIGAELSTASVTLTRFVTDFMNWGSSEYRFIDLPDHLCGISSAMPQKKNLTVLERIRGKLAHISAYYVDFVMGQQRTPYTNLVETAKEGGSNFLSMLTTMHLAIKLLTHVISNMQFNRDRMDKICNQEFFGGFSLANYLTQQFDIPYRISQIVAGKYITSMIEHDRLPADVDQRLLQELCLEFGFPTVIKEDVLARLFSADAGLSMKQSLGSTHPDQVAALLSIQERERKIQREDLRKKKEQCQTYLL